VKRNITIWWKIFILCQIRNIIMNC